MMSPATTLYLHITYHYLTIQIWLCLFRLALTLLGLSGAASNSSTSVEQNGGNRCWSVSEDVVKLLVELYLHIILPLPVSPL